MERMEWPKSLSCAAAVIFLSMFGTLTSQASGRVISSVTLKVASGLEPGFELPGIDYGSSEVSAEDGEVVVGVSGSKYYVADAEWVGSSNEVVSVGDTPQMKVRLSPSDSDDYYFRGSYRSSNVTIRGGELIKTSVSGDDLYIWLRVNAVKGDFDPPSDAYWKSGAKGIAQWDEPEENGTGRYEVSLKRGSSSIATVKTDYTSYDFYPYMTAEGRYKFRVRTIARTNSQEDYGENSDWTDSDEIYITAEDVSDGSGQRGDTLSSQDCVQEVSAGMPAVSSASAGWVQSAGYWYYRYPDGTYQKDGWQKIDGNWYLFQNDGKMLTGWQFWKEHYYLLDDNGAMLTGWVEKAGKFYYFNPTSDAYEGCMFRSQMLTIDGNDYYFDSDGSRAEGWREFGGNWYYFYPGSGIKARDTIVETFYVDENGAWSR